jgi:rusticyanin
MTSTRLAAVIGTVAITAAGLAALAGCGTTTKVPAASASTAAASASPAAASASPAAVEAGGSAYAYYRTMMGRLYGGGTMMGGGSYGWMMGATGYQWMMGGAAAPAWMRGSALPGFMMGTSTDPGQVMGSLFANAPGPRVGAARAAQLGNQVPAGATLGRAANRITFTSTSVRLTVLASPTGSPDETFRIAGLTDPAITVPAGAQVSIEVINADPDVAHGLVITADGGTFSSMPMVTARPAFPGSAVWFLGNPTPAGMHAATLSFTATKAGSYRYLCPVPGHAQEGMTGAFTVSST